MDATGFTDSGILPSASNVSPSSDTPLRGFEVAAVPKFVDADPMSDDFQPTSPKDDHAHHPTSITDEDDKIPQSVDTQRTADPLDVVPQVSPQPSIDSKFTLPLKGMRCFLDICCGVNSPLSNAVQSLHGDVMRFDILIHNYDDLLDTACYENLLRVCSSGIVAYAGASPSCWSTAD